MEKTIDDFREKMEDPQTRWAIVAVVVCLMISFKMYLFAVSVPILVYYHWHLSPGNSDSNSEDVQHDRHHVNHGNNHVNHVNNQGDEDFDDEDDDGNDYEEKGREPKVDPYDDEFWDEKRQSKDLLSSAAADDHDLDTSFGGTSKTSDFGSRQAADDDDFFPRPKPSDFDFSGLGSGSLGDDLDFGLGSSLDNMDFGSSFNDFGDDRNKGKGKGKGKGKDGDSKGKGKGKDGEPDERQLFVAGIGDLEEDVIRHFFEEAGEVIRLKLLKHPDGQSKGVCFVTYRTEEQSADARRMWSRGAELEGRRLTVRQANGGKGNEKGEKGDRGEGKGGKGKSNRDRDRDFDFQADRHYDGPDSRDRPDGSDNRRSSRAPVQRTELDDMLEEALEEENGPLLFEDFDIGAKRFLQELMSRGEGHRAVEAIDFVFQQTKEKKRENINKPTAYVFRLLQKYDPKVSEDVAEKNLERKMQERSNRRDGGTEPKRGEMARAWALAPDTEAVENVGGRQLIDRFGKPVVIY